ncbi:hypothetical protein GOP47_0018914 [Adiantum capillus-veneris]|uniref:Uncharacterized protein n=1 Tax=Adiantum capillus-veneris TaxID=13818 RepID=A0A9D4UEA6_ADICA|nr:hypothetical protein GOP47_0018914 [Adiantum capillus-veneris]
MATLTRPPSPYAPSSSSHLSSYARACSPSLSFLHLQPSALSASCCSRGYYGTCVAMAATTSSSIQDLLLSPRVGSSSDDNFASSLFGSLTDVIAPQEPKPAVECPPGLCRYETMAILRPDITEEQRLELTQRYEEAIIAGGGMGVEMFNRGMMPLTYNIRRKDMQGINNRYLDGVFFLFTYCTKPQSVSDLEKKFRADDDVIRSSTFKVKPPRPST